MTDLELDYANAVGVQAMEPCYICEGFGSKPEWWDEEHEVPPTTGDRCPVCEGEGWARASW